MGIPEFFLLLLGQSRDPKALSPSRHGGMSDNILGDCDPTAWSESPGPRRCGFTGFLDVSGTNSAAHNFPVPAGTTLMRVAFNGTASSSGGVDTNYSLRASTRRPRLNSIAPPPAPSGSVKFRIRSPTSGIRSSIKRSIRANTR